MPIKQRDGSTISEREDAHRLRGLVPGAGVAAHPVGIAVLVYREENGEAFIIAEIDHVDAGEVPAGDAQVELPQVAPRRRHLVAHAFHRHRGVGPADLAADVDAEGRLQDGAVRTRP